MGFQLDRSWETTGDLQQRDSTGVCEHRQRWRMQTQHCWLFTLDTMKH